ncbi:MAG TPA: YqgE/AlgH family protein [Bacteroidia bacterium]
MIAEQGKILIAQPFLNDGYFKRSVILLTEHNEYGTMGFVMNKPMHLKLKDVLPMFPDLLHPLFKGGPVADNQLFFVHRYGADITNSMPIGRDGWFWGGNFEDVIKLLRENQVSNSDIRFFIGYSGWEANQLEIELEDKAWFVNEPDYTILMDEDAEHAWGNELKRMGSNFAVLGNFPEDPSMN